MGVEGRIKMPTKKNKLPKILWHHGTCDCCGKKFTLVCHFGYDTQPKRDYRMCIRCLSENLEVMMFGWMIYKVDDTIDRLYKKGD